MHVCDKLCRNLLGETLNSDVRLLDHWLVLLVRPGKCISCAASHPFQGILTASTHLVFTSSSMGCQWHHTPSE